MRGKGLKRDGSWYNKREEREEHRGERKKKEELRRGGGKRVTMDLNNGKEKSCIKWKSKQTPPLKWTLPNMLPWTYLSCRKCNFRVLVVVQRC